MTACYVEYNGVKYSVTRSDTFEGYWQDITLYCKRMQNGRGVNPCRYVIRCGTLYTKTDCELDRNPFS